MKVIDLTHIFQSNISLFPGDENPIIEEVLNVKEHGYKTTKINMTTHLGTHLDCKSHVFENGFTTSDANLNKFLGQGIVIDCSMVKKGEKIDVNILKQYDLSCKDFILIYTNWNSFWKNEEYIKDYPVLSEQAAKYLTSFNIKGIGLDTISIDSIDNEELTNHKILLGKDVVIIENLKNLHKLLNKEFQFSALPLKIKNGDGSPVRAVAIID
ncbi:cyclase family protein [Clostridium tetani]|uniref:cyclase family protein n=1 Tax=Clostridium tetani TaxID=1513 RepID=UPI000E1171A1|nr:cyclase family protein [Clostridium tetani]RXI52209.1 cyclase family protein [Clostridium tetani]RXI53979.1 cyclase family protein [Clostridium tetani]RXI75054.1 cyclase family protein [Clostridium tetani]RXM69045.1 cyclase family protein [Clostridium tetani]WFN61164.1 cyclase family protein [Clostridium tetani]